MKYNWTIGRESEYQNVLPALLDACGKINKWQLHGEMGAGKTTFVKQLGTFLGLSGVSSPTYGIINSYELNVVRPPFQNGLIHHMDLYRLKSEEELLDIGWEEYIYGNEGLIVEWPQLAASLWPPPFVEIHIRVNAETEERKLILILRS
jgi:tRNA threonylcarbamoyladenosine biosynthesis protein TsaE